MADLRSILVEIAPGELIDKITILEIKNQRMTDPHKLRNVRTELATLCEARDGAIEPSPMIAELTGQLRAVNEALWMIEDGIRICERTGDFGPTFLKLARSVYQNNDRRADLKRRINEHLGSRLIEEKSYESYEVPAEA
jgi:Family of unknown function (DUF6165)